MTDLLVAASDSSFGANQFYGHYPSWERTKGLVRRRAAGAWAARPWRPSPIVATRTSSSCSATIRPIYENNHIDGSWQASLRRTKTSRRKSALLLLLGLEGDRIDSYKFQEQQSSRWASMRATAARATWIWICARRRSAGACRPARARRFSRVARKRCFRRSWPAASAWRTV